MQLSRFAAASMLTLSGALALGGGPAFADDYPETVEVVHADQAEPPPRPRKPTGTFSIGAGYSPDDGFIVMPKEIANTGEEWFFFGTKTTLPG